MTANLSRRSFLKSASAMAAATLVVGYDAGDALASASQVSELNPFVRIAPDGTVTAVIKHFECGQGHRYRFGDADRRRAEHAVGHD